MDNKLLIENCITFLNLSKKFVKDLRIKTERDYDEKIAAVSLIETVISILKKIKEDDDGNN